MINSTAWRNGTLNITTMTKGLGAVRCFFKDIDTFIQLCCIKLIKSDITDISKVKVSTTIFNITAVFSIENNKKCVSLVFTTACWECGRTSAVSHLLSGLDLDSNQTLPPTSCDGIDTLTSRCFIYLSRTPEQREHHSASHWLMNIDSPREGQWVIPWACRGDGDQ